MSKIFGVDQSREACENAVQNFYQSEYWEKTPGQQRKKKSISGSIIHSTKLLPMK